MNRTRRPIQRFSFTDELLRFSVADLSWICELCRNLLVSLELRNRRFVANRDQHLLFPFFAFLRRDEGPHSGRGFFQLVIVAIHVLRVGQMARRTYRVTEDFVRGRHLVGRR